MTLNENMNRFRVASRELFNNFFHILPATGKTSEAAQNAPSVDFTDVWDHADRFSRVEEVLFENLVCEPEQLTHVKYGNVQSEILVELKSERSTIMINRELNSGYWDFPLREVTSDARLLFISFFDWYDIDYRDNRYVLVLVDAWPSHPETVGKQALIESHCVHFVRAASPDRQMTS